MDPLYYRVKLLPDRDLTKYIIAYRSITLIPSDQVGAWAEYRDDNVATTKVTVKEGRSASKSIEIHAEDVYIYAGSNFNFKEKTLTITANRIFCVASPSGSLNNAIQFDCSGRDSQVGFAQAADDGVKGQACGLNWGRFPWMSQEDWIIARPKTLPPVTDPNANLGGPGGNGVSGSDGNNGRAGGIINLKARLMSASPTKCSLLLNVNGGQGGTGQNGGKGGAGGNLTVDSHHPGNVKMFTGAARYVGPGGSGGDGGNAGKWGKRGRVNVAYSGNPLFDIDVAQGPLRSTKGGDPGEGGSRGEIEHIFGFGIGPGDPSVGPWPPEKGQSGTEGKSQREEADSGDTVALSNAQSGGILDLDQMEMIFARLQREQTALAESAEITPAMMAAFKESVDWLQADVALLKSAPFSPTAPEIGRINKLGTALLSLKQLAPGH
ncbi:hypothetical protein BKA63DRAFT_518206 [Paraphoma chrysanthemicola]|nr:hypothetical protein BKA63DRAFT_518206 [Paraphoma chrysanthemicola]